MAIPYEGILVELSKQNARYLVVGAVAMNAHGYFRSTYDLDIMPDLSEKNLDKFLNVLKQKKYKPRVPVNPEELKDSKKREEWYNEKNMGVFSFWRDNDTSEIDLLIYHPIDFEKAYERKSIVHLQGINIPVASVKDLIEMKKISGRDKDLLDIKTLETMLKNG